MLYHSTNNPNHRVDLKEAILRSLPRTTGSTCRTSFGVG
jgi:threonine synthase